MPHFPNILNTKFNGLLGEAGGSTPVETETDIPVNLDQLGSSPCENHLESLKHPFSRGTFDEVGHNVAAKLSHLVELHFGLTKVCQWKKLDSVDSR